MQPPDVELIGVTKTYGDFAAVEECSLDIGQGEFVTLLGPSGCGKTTTLNMIAGFFPPTRGVIRIRGTDVTGLPPNRRQVGMVFQNYALFPHLTVAENVGFGLKMRGVAKAEIAATAQRALGLVHMDHLGARYPRQLSGGQQQRVALARAVAPAPSVLLLDEPLSNLDLKLRESMRRELKTLQRELGVTAVFVTHDQDEALTMSDRVVVMNAGRIEQRGTPEDIYARPTSRFVAAFVGQMNFFEGSVQEAAGGGMALVLEGTDVQLTLPEKVSVKHGERLHCGIRPEVLTVGGPADNGGGGHTMTGTIEDVILAGSIRQIHVRIGSGQSLRVDMLNIVDGSALSVGDTVHVGYETADLIVFQH